jgi:hypothetical protein
MWLAPSPSYRRPLLLQCRWSPVLTWFRQRLWWQWRWNPA